RRSRKQPFGDFRLQALSGATLNQEAVSARDRHSLDQAVSLLVAERGDVDRGKRVRRLEPEVRARTHAGEALFRLQHRQRAIEPLEIVDLHWVRQCTHRVKWLQTRPRRDDLAAAPSTAA